MAFLPHGLTNFTSIFYVYFLNEKKLCNFFHQSQFFWTMGEQSFHKLANMYFENLRKNMLKNPTNHNLFGPHWANEHCTFLQKKYSI